MGIYIVPNSRNFLSLSGGTVSGGTYFSNSLSANTFYSGSTPLEQIIYSISSQYSADTSVDVFIQPGINTYTGGTTSNPTVNLSSLTVDYIVVTGSSLFNTVQVSSFSGSGIMMVVTDNLGNLSIQSVPSNGQSTVIRNGLNTYTSGTFSDYSINVSALTINTLTASGNSVFTGTLSVGSSFSANTIFSGSNNIENIFSLTGHTHEFSTILNTAHTHSVSDVNNLLGSLNTKINKSGDTMTGGLITTSLSATTLSASTINSGSTNLYNIFSQLGHTHEFSAILNTAHTHTISDISNLLGSLNTKVNKSGDTMTGGLITTSLSATTLSGGTIYSGSTNLEEIFVKPYQVVWEYQPNYNSFRTKNSSNNVYGTNSFAAGVSNLINITSSKSTILNGNSNSINSGNNGRYSSVINGKNNTINLPEVYSGIYSINNILQRYGSGIIVGGKNNSTNGIYSTILNGIENKINTVSGGNAYNFISNNILNGYQNYIKNNSSYSTIINGLLNVINNTAFSTIDSSKNSKIYSSQYSFINSGLYNSIYNSTATSIFSSRNTILSGCTHTVAIGLEDYNNNNKIVNNTLILSNLLILNTGNSNVFSATSLSATTIQSDNLTGLTTQMVIANPSGILSTYPIPSAGQSTIVRNGLNTYTSGTFADYSINVSALTINTLSASGNSVFSGTLSGGSSFSANTLYSGSTNLYNIFSQLGHTHEFSTILNTAHTHSISDVSNLSESLNTKVNKSGDTMTGGLLTPSLSATTLSGGTIYSGSTNLYNIFSTTAHTHTGGIGFVIDNGYSVITTGLKGYVTIPYNATIVSWTVMADVSGDIVIDVWKNTYVNYPPTIADTIAGTEKITLSSQQKNQDLSLTSWTTSVSSGDILAFNVDSVSTIKKAYVMINVIKTS